MHENTKILLTPVNYLIYPEPSTTDLEYLYISEAIWNEIKDSKKFKTCGNWEHLSFNSDGKMKIRL